jgi:NADH-quinone oxidoreductase subunit N
MAVIGLLNSTIALYYYLNVLREVFITEPITDEPLEISPSLMVSVQICILGVLAMGLWPAPFLELAKTAASSLF